MSDQDFGIHFESEWPLIQEMRDAAAREKEKAPQMTITEFLLARIAEDEAAATAAAKGPWKWEGDAGEDEAFMYDANGTSVLSAYGMHSQGFLECSGADADHIARHNPHRVLAECKAKRAIIKHAQEATEVEKEYDDYEWQGTVQISEPWAGDAILLSLAAVYADHPDYQQEWAPSDTPKKV